MQKELETLKQVMRNKINTHYMDGGDQTTILHNKEYLGELPTKAI